MKIGSLKEVMLSKAGEFFLFDCRVFGLDSQTLQAYRDVLGSFVAFTGDILVKDLTLDQVRLYIANLSDGPSEGQEHNSIVMNHYAIIHEWARWVYAQESLTGRVVPVAPPDPDNLSVRSRKIRTYCA